MTSVEQFDILLEHDIDEQYQYEPGELLSGAVQLRLSQPIKISAIQVQIRGESTVSWEEETRQQQQPVTYTADEVYVNVTQTIAQAENGQLMTLDRGTHRFPMEYLLPENLPSSFIGKHGSITYVVKATLKEDRRLGLSSMITSEPFLLLRKLDIMQEHKLLMAREETLVKRFSGGFAFCSSGKVTCTFKVNKTGHLPGEDIFMDAEISNQSPRVVEAIEAAVIMHSTFYARNKSRYNRQVVNKKRDEWELIEGEGRRWKSVRLTIPPYIPESRLDGCDIIDIRYELNFRIDISGKNNFLTCSIPITVGSATNSNHSKKSTAYSQHGMSNWRSKDDLYNDATLPIRGQVNDSAAGTGAASANNMHPQSADIRSVDDVDPEMFSDATLRFRRPIDIGETRHNPLMDFVADGGGAGGGDQADFSAGTDHTPNNYPDSDDGQYNRLSDYDQAASATRQDEFHIEPDTTEGMSDDDDDDDDMPPPPTPSQIAATPPTPTNAPPTPGLPPPPPGSAPPAPPPLRPGP